MAVFLFNDTATTEIYTLSLHDALPILDQDAGDTFTFALTGAAAALFTIVGNEIRVAEGAKIDFEKAQSHELTDRKSTRLNSSHANISYAVFCLKKKTSSNTPTNPRPQI